MKRKKPEKHGLSHQPIYDVWAMMKQRCFNRNQKAYKNYGKRGITICERWLSFNNFYQDMIGTYSKGLHINRIDNNGNYELSNCEWTTQKINNRNTRLARYINFNGVSKCIGEWCEIQGIKRKKFEKRKYRGWSDLEALDLIPKGKVVNV
jgi:hypothetical protein